MASSNQRFERVVHALEDLAARESVQLANEDYTAMLQTQEQAAPLVDFLTHPNGKHAPASLYARIAAVIRTRADTERKLAGRTIIARDALNELDLSRRRVARIAPAYGPMAAATVRSRFCGEG